jgi:hypothetical protein
MCGRSLEMDGENNKNLMWLRLAAHDEIMMMWFKLV